MAANIPAKIRQAGITPFVLRASQLDAARPIISYWCMYRLNQRQYTMVV